MKEGKELWRQVVIGVDAGVRRLDRLLRRLPDEGSHVRVLFGVEGWSDVHGLT